MELIEDGALELLNTFVNHLLIDTATAFSLRRAVPSSNSRDNGFAHSVRIKMYLIVARKRQFAHTIFRRPY